MDFAVEGKGPASSLYFVCVVLLANMLLLNLILAAVLEGSYDKFESHYDNQVRRSGSCTGFTCTRLCTCCQLVNIRAQNLCAYRGDTRATINTRAEPRVPHISHTHITSHHTSFHTVTRFLTLCPHPRPHQIVVFKLISNLKRQVARLAFSRWLKFSEKKLEKKRRQSALVQQLFRDTEGGLKTISGFDAAAASNKRMWNSISNLKGDLDLIYTKQVQQAAGKVGKKKPHST